MIFIFKMQNIIFKMKNNFTNVLNDKLEKSNSKNFKE